jgi:predicted tellurium resistance membrane protein TerC
MDEFETLFRSVWLIIMSAGLAVAFLNWFSTILAKFVRYRSAATMPAATNILAVTAINIIAHAFPKVLLAMIANPGLRFLLVHGKPSLVKGWHKRGLG